MCPLPICLSWPNFLLFFCFPVPSGSILYSLVSASFWPRSVWLHRLVPVICVLFMCGAQCLPFVSPRFLHFRYLSVAFPSVILKICMTLCGFVLLSLELVPS